MTKGDANFPPNILVPTVPAAAFPATAVPMDLPRIAPPADKATVSSGVFSKFAGTFLIF